VPISLVQQGTATEFEFLKLVILGGGGELEASRPATDDDRRDADVHRRSDFNLGTGWQIKSATHVDHPWAADRLHIRFTVLKDRLITHPLFYYFFAFLDLRIMRFADPVFIVPSAEVHEHAIPHLHGDTWHFDFDASLGPNAHDRWVPSRVNTLEVGQRILTIIRDLEQSTSPAGIILPSPSAGVILPDVSDLLWVRRLNAAA
jgi:hypothetical protein